MILTIAGIWLKRESKQNILKTHNAVLGHIKVTQIKSFNVSYISPEMVHEALERRKIRTSDDLRPRLVLEPL